MTPVRQRIVRRTPATISWQPIDSTGETGADPGTVTVTVTNAAGTVLVSDAATTGTGTSPRTYALAATHTTNLDVLTATWEVSNVTVGVTYHEIVGSVYFTIPELRAEEPSLADGAKYPTATLIRHRDEVETSFESWTNMAWVPRFSTADVTAESGELHTGKLAITAVRWYRRYSSPSTYTEAPAADLLLTRGTYWGQLLGTYWTDRIVAGVEHGQLAPPADLKRVAMRYCRKLADRKFAGLSDRATSYTTPEGMTVNVGRIGTEWRPTGDEIVDEVLRRKPDIDHRDIGRGSVSLLVTRDEASSYFRPYADSILRL